MHDLRFDPDTLLHADDDEDMTYPAVRYDLRTADQQQGDSVTALRAEVAALRELVQLTTGPIDVALRVDRLTDEVQYLRLKVERLEGDGK